MEALVYFVIWGVFIFLMMRMGQREGGKPEVVSA